MVILTKERISQFLRDKKFWRGRNVTVAIYTDGSNIEIVSPELEGVPKYKYYRDVTAEVSKWVQGKLLKDKLVDKLSDIAVKCVKQWGLNKKDIKVNKSELVENPKQTPKFVSKSTRLYEMNDDKQGKLNKELKGYKEISKVYAKNTSLLNLKNAKITVQDFLFIYSGIILSDNLMEKILEAHEDILKHSKSSKMEKLIVIDLDTEQIILEQVGVIAGEIKWDFPLGYKGNRVITIHNHPGNKSFSADDWITFNNEVRIEISVVQGNEGSLYLLSKRKRNYNTINRIQEVIEFSELVSDWVDSGKDITKELDNLVGKKATKNSWIYRRRMK